MTYSIKTDLQNYLQLTREALLWKLDGLSEYDMRRPMTPTGTNLLGLIKHLTAVELGYFVWTFDRPSTVAVPWAEAGAEPSSDMWAAPDESSEYILDLYRQVRAHADDTIDALALDTVGRVPHWPSDTADVTLGRIIVHVIVEIARHTGHADIVREGIDGSVGLRLGNENMEAGDEDYWRKYRHNVDDAARRAGR